MTPSRGFLATLMAALALALALAGCGRSATTATTGPLPGTAPSTTAATGATGTTGTGAPTTPATGSVSSPIIQPGRTTTTVRRVTARPPSPVPVEIALTMADDGTTVGLRVGDHVRLLLDDPNWQWTNANVTPDGVLAGLPAPAPPAHGVLLLWTAVRAGTALIAATGSPWCSAGVACPMFARRYRVNLAIS